jgi:hypothetical protein
VTDVDRVQTLLDRARAQTPDGHLVRALLALADAETALMTAAALAMREDDPRERRVWDIYDVLLKLTSRVRELADPETPT